MNFEEKDFKIAELEAESATYQEQIDFLQKEKQSALELVAQQEYNKLVQKQREGMLTQRDLEIAGMQERIASMNKDKKVQEEELAQMVRIGSTDEGVGSNFILLCFMKTFETCKYRCSSTLIIMY